ncbi:MAG: phage portal protein, partial [Acutalibacteraceae bacterium]|nr:phage portal protein [Acutalibacteraceae bacterium]
LKYATKLRDDDLKASVKDFSDTYLSVESDTFGAAGVSGDCDIVRVEPKDYVPNAAQTKEVKERVYAFFNTNDKIVHSNYTEDEWNAYFESVVEPTALQLSNEYTRKLFSRRERAAGNRIYFDASNLQCATLQTKLALVGMVDRGALTPNEWRNTFNLSPLDGGDIPIRRLDTAPTAKGGEER